MCFNVNDIDLALNETRTLTHIHSHANRNKHLLSTSYHPSLLRFLRSLFCSAAAAVVAAAETIAAVAEGLKSKLFVYYDIGNVQLKHGLASSAPQGKAHGAQVRS